MHIYTKLKEFKSRVDIFFISLMLFFTLFDLNIFNKYIHDRVILFIFILSLWILFKILFYKINFKSVFFYDIGFIVLLFYFNTNFFLLSETTFYYSKYALFIGYFFVFYVFRWYLKDDDTKSRKLYFFLLIIVVLCILQSFLSLLQYTELISVKNKYFTLLGSFSSPNYLALYLSFGVTILLWRLFVIGLTNKVKNILIIFSIIIMGIVIVMSKSRGTFLSLLFSIFILLITSKKNSQFLFKKINLKKIFLATSIITILFFTFKYLYNSDVESIKGRKLISKITLQEIIKKPLKGYGAFNFAGGYNKSKSDYFNITERQWEEIKVGNYVYTAFNDYILIGYEFGLPFLFLILLLLIIILFKVKITDSTRIGIALLVNILVWSFFNSAIGNVSIMLVGIFSLSILMTFGDLKDSFLIEKKKNHKVAFFILLFFVFFGIYGVYTKISASTEINFFLKYSNVPFDKTRFINLAKKLENNRNIDFNIGRRLYSKGFKEDGYKFMEKSFKKTCHPKSGQKLAHLHTNDGNFKRAAEIYQINIGLEPFRYEPKMNLISLMERTHNFQKVVDLSKEVIRFPVKIPSEIINNYKKEALKNVNSYSLNAK